MTSTSPKKVVLASLKSDLQKEREGDWIPAPSIGPDVKLLVRSTNYPPFTIARDEVNQKIAKKYDGERVPDDVLAQANGELFAEHLLLGWQGLDQEYEPDLAAAVLTDEAHRVMRNAVLLAATKVGQSEVKFVENTAKN
jgi:hypothetical protein